MWNIYYAKKSGALHTDRIALKIASADFDPLAYVAAWFDKKKEKKPLIPVTHPKIPIPQAIPCIYVKPDTSFK